jgi:hypothetical protein
VSYSIPISIDDGQTRILEARFLHVSLEDRGGEVILNHDLIGHFLGSLTRSRGSRSRKGRSGVEQQEPVQWGAEAIKGEREGETADEDKGVWILAVSKKACLCSKIRWLVVEETGCGLGFSLYRVPPIENNPSQRTLSTIHLESGFRAFDSENEDL